MKVMEVSDTAEKIPFSLLHLSTSIIDKWCYYKTVDHILLEMFSLFGPQLWVSRYYKKQQIQKPSTM